jgi:hypothetical protein
MMHVQFGMVGVILNVMLTINPLAVKMEFVGNMPALIALHKVLAAQQI